MTNNITGEQGKQKFSFTANATIDNATYSSVQVHHVAYYYNSFSNTRHCLLERIQP
jgi:hypothetical protein